MNQKQQRVIVAAAGFAGAVAVVGLARLHANHRNELLQQKTMAHAAWEKCNSQYIPNTRGLRLYHLQEKSELYEGMQAAVADGQLHYIDYEGNLVIESGTYSTQSHEKHIIGIRQEEISERISYNFRNGTATIYETMLIPIGRKGDKNTFNHHSSILIVPFNDLPPETIKNARGILLGLAADAKADGIMFSRLHPAVQKMYNESVEQKKPVEPGPEPAVPSPH